MGLWSQIPNHFSIFLTNAEVFRRFISSCHTVTTWFFYETDADKTMNLQHFGRDPVHIRMWIQISPAIQIWIPDHFRLKFWYWRRFALSEHTLVCDVCTDTCDRNAKCSECSWDLTSPCAARFWSYTWRVHVTDITPHCLDPLTNSFYVMLYEHGNS